MSYSKLPKACIKSLITMQYPAWQGNLFLLDEVDSTNSYLLAKVKNNLKKGSIALADTQTAGRGQKNRTWVSPAGHNLYASFYYPFPSLEHIKGLSLAIGIYVAQFLYELGASKIGIKWPNDLMSSWHKLGGILIENIIDPKGISHCVIGLGLNLHLPQHYKANIQQPVTDLNTLLQADVDRWSLTIDLAARILKGLEAFEVHGLSKIMSEWNRFDLLKGLEISVIDFKNVMLTGVAQGINLSGALLLQQNSQITEITDNFRLAEISHSQF